jgi:hypothetical protein
VGVPSRIIIIIVIRVLLVIYLAARHPQPPLHNALASAPVVLMLRVTRARAWRGWHLGAIVIIIFSIVEIFCIIALAPCCP